MFHVVLHQPEIPQNTGNIGRTCVAVGAKLWLVRPFGFRLDEARLRRAGLDYWQHLDVQTVDHWQACCDQLPDASRWYFSRHARRDYREVEYAADSVFVFGSETQGLPSTICQTDDERALRIPTTDAVRSLNVSNAVAVALYEAVRQTGALQERRARE
jgi:tRNA (cytidine/uridine-2'-O-)-methyltransferase